MIKIHREFFGPYHLGIWARLDKDFSCDLFEKIRDALLRGDTRILFAHRYRIEESIEDYTR